MKRLNRMPWLVGSSLGLVGVVGLATVPVACVSSNNATPTDDSGLPVVGDDSGSPSEDASASPHDASIGDGGADAAESNVGDAGPAPLTVQVLVGTTPEPGIVIVFQDATGAVTSTSTTDTTGKVSQLVAAGSQLTAVMGTPGSASLVTIQAVEPGDSLTIFDTSNTSASDSVGEDVAVTFPPTTWDAAAAYTQAYVGSCRNDIADPIYVTSRCVGSATGTFPVFARATLGGGELGYTYQTNNAFYDDGGAEDITVARNWITPTGMNETITASALPTLPDDAGVALQDAVLAYAEVSGGVTLTLDPLVQGVGNTPTSIFGIHAGYPDFVQAQGSVGINGISELSGVFSATRGPAPTTAHADSIDLSTVPPFLSASMAYSDGGAGALQPTVTWTSAGSLAATAGVLTQLQWYGSNPDGGQDELAGSWTILAPPTATSITAPAMPSSVSLLVPQSGSNYQPPRVVALKGTFLPGYPALRAQFGAVPIFAQGWEATIPSLPVAGTLTFAAIYPDEG